MLISKVRNLERTTIKLQRISEGEFRRYTFPIEQFERYFDYCASLFIFIGLVGTMSGFVQAVPQLKNDTYDFHNFGDALMTSAFGIVWSALLVGGLSIYNFLSISPAFEKLLKKQTLDQLADLLGQELSRFGTQITASLNKGLSDFSNSANSVASATRALSDTAGGAANSFTSSSEALNKSAQTVNEIYKRASTLPESVSKQLEVTFSAQNDRLKTLFETQLSELTTTSDSVSSTFQASQKRWEQERTKSFEAERVRMSQFLDTLQEGYRAMLFREQEQLSDGAAAAVASLKALFEAYGTSMSQAEKRVPEQIQNAYSQAVSKAQEATTNLSSFVAESARTTEALKLVASDFKNSLAGLTGALRSITDVISRVDPRDTHELNRKLDAVLSSLNANGHATDQMKREGKIRRRWHWPLFHRGDK
jgi:hypothetical protein